MFFDIYAALCASVGKKPSTVALELGISKSTVSNWKKGGHTPQAAQLQKIADYFGVTVDSLLDKEKAPTAVQGDERTEKEMKLKSITSDFTADELRQLEDYAAFLKSKRNQ